MNIKDKKILILGMGITGSASAKALVEMGAEVAIMDDNIEKIMNENHEIRELNLTVIKSDKELLEYGAELCVKSPGLSPKNAMVLGAKNLGIEVISDLELTYRLFPDRTIVAITGTNGKTTTTALVGHILRQGNIPVHVAGNIGVGMLMEFLNGGSDDYYVLECSSFQLEDTVEFKPTIAAIINITPDHLDWHGGYKSYIDAKLKLIRNMPESGSFVLNYEDEQLRKLDGEYNGNPIFISRLNELKNGYYVKDEMIVHALDGIVEEIANVSSIQMLGTHNIENVLVAVALTHTLGTSKEMIANGIRTFKGVPHRIEFVREIGGVCYYNDSKGTNVDASIKAVEAVNSPIILIAGGYDKKVSFEDFFKAFNGKVKHMIIMGQTGEMLEALAEKNGIEYKLVENMEQAVAYAGRIAIEGENVLLSPACASWGMYPNFEVRGEHFKELVLELGR